MFFPISLMGQQFAHHECAGAIFAIKSALLAYITTPLHNNEKSFYLSENLLLYLNNRYCVSDNFQYSKKNRVLFFDLGYSKSGNAFDKFHGHTVFYKQSQIKSQTIMFYLNLPCSSTLARFQILHLMFLQIF